MAITATLIKQNVTGDQRMAQYNVTVDAASQAFQTSLGNIEAAFISPISMNTAGPLVRINKNAAGTATLGSIGFSANTGGDNFFVMVFGRS